MKFFAFAFAMLLAGVHAVPSLGQVATEEETRINERFIDGIVADLIAGVAQQIRDAGLDPLVIDSRSLNYKLPVTDLLIVEAALENVVSEGLSNIIINNISFGILTSRLQMTVSLPQISVAADNAHIDAQLLGWDFSADISGSLVISQIRAVVDVRINIGIISGISLRSVDVDFSLGGVESNLNVNLQGHDLSGAINQFAGASLPNALAANRAEINELLEYVIMLLANDLF